MKMEVPKPRGTFETRKKEWGGDGDGAFPPNSVERNKYRKEVPKNRAVK